MAWNTSVAGTASSGVNTTSYTLVINASVTAGDILVLATVNRDSTANPTVVDNDTGGNTWTRLVTQAAGTNGAVSVWWKRATSGTASKTITVSGNTGSCAGVVKPFRGGVVGIDPFTGTTPVGEANASGDETQAGITTQSRRSMVLLAVGVTSNDTLNVATVTATDPTSLAEAGEGVSTGGSDCSCSLNFAEKTVAGATGNINWAMTNGTTGSVAVALQPDNEGTSAATLGEATLSATGTAPLPEIVGTLNTSLGALTLAAIAQAEAQGTLAQSLGVATLTATAQAEVRGSLAQSLEATILSATGTVADAGAVGDLNVTLGAATLGAAATAEIRAALASALDNIVSVGTGQVFVSGSLARTLGDLVPGSTGTVLVLGSATISLGTLALYTIPEPVSYVITRSVCTNQAIPRSVISDKMVERRAA